jgi:hypothetical protein
MSTPEVGREMRFTAGSIGVFLAILVCLTLIVPARAIESGTQTVCGAPTVDGGTTTIDGVELGLDVWDDFVFDAVKIADSVDQPVCAELTTDVDGTILSADLIADFSFCGPVTLNVDRPAVAGAVLDPTITSLGTWLLLLLAGDAQAEACVEIVAPGHFVFDVAVTVAEVCADVIEVAPGSITFPISQYGREVAMETQVSTDGIEVGSHVCAAAHAGIQVSVPTADSLEVVRGPNLLPNTAMVRRPGQTAGPFWQSAPEDKAAAIPTHRSSLLAQEAGNGRASRQKVET